MVDSRAESHGDAISIENLNLLKTVYYAGSGNPELKNRVTHYDVIKPREVKL